MKWRECLPVLGCESNSLPQASVHKISAFAAFHVNEDAQASKWTGHITGRVDQDLFLRNEYLAAENRILRAKINGRLQLSDGEKSALAEIARRLGRKALDEVAVVASPDTILRWFRKLVARNFDARF